MRFSVRFYRAVAACSLLSTVTTLGLKYLPFFYPSLPDLPDFAYRLALGHDPADLLRAWAYLLHYSLVFAAALGLAARCRFRSAGAAKLGLAGFALWAVTQASQPPLTNVVFHGTWRAAWPSADATARALIRERVAMSDVVWDAMSLLLLLGFFLGNVFLAHAVRRVALTDAVARGLGRWVSAALWAAAGLTLGKLLQEFDFLRAEPVIARFYPLILPAGRVLIGTWLWREANWEQPEA